MEGAFNHVGNHLISDSAAAIKADNDDLSAIDPDENLLYSKYGGRDGLGSATRRRQDDDDNDTEAAFDDADNDSVVSTLADNLQYAKLEDHEEEEEEKELPAHACA